MKATALKTTLGGVAFALFAGATLLATPASAGSVSNAVYRADTSPATYQEVRRRVFVAPAYAYDPYYNGPAYYGPSIAYAPPVEYAPPVAYDYDYDYGPPPAAYYGPGPGVGFAAPGVGVAVGY